MEVYIVYCYTRDKNTEVFRGRHIVNVFSDEAMAVDMVDRMNALTPHPGQEYKETWGYTPRNLIS